MKFIFVYRNIKYGGCEFLIEKLAREIRRIKPRGDRIICMCESISTEMNEILSRERVEIIKINPWIELVENIDKLTGKINIVVFEGDQFIRLFYQKKKYKKTLLYAVHPRAISGFGDNDDVRTNYKDLAGNFVDELSKRSHIVAMDEAVKNDTEKFYKRKLNLDIVRICVDSQKNSSQRNIDYVLNNPLVLTVARAEFPFKGYLLGLIRWFDNYEFDNLKLEIVTFGEGVDEISFEIDKLKTSKKEKVILKNMVQHEELGKLYEKAAVYVGMGTSVLESAINKIPTIPIKPDTYELMCNGRFDENPFYICGDDSLDWKNFSKCITEILTMEKNKYEKIANRGYEAVCNIYDTKVIARSLERVLDKCSYDYDDGSSSAITEFNDKRHIIEELLIKRIDALINESKGRDIYIWGCGIGGKDAFGLMKKEGVKIKAFVDRNYKQLGSLFGVPVISKNKLNPKRDYVIVSTKKCNREIIQYLNNRKFFLNMDYKLFYDIYSQWEVF